MEKSTKRRAGHALFFEGIKECQRRVTRARETMASLKQNKKLLVVVAQTLSDAVGEDVPITIFPSGDDVTFSVTLWKMDSMKDSRVTRVLDACEMCGEYRATHDYAASLNREFIYDVNENVQIRVNVYVRDDSETCRRILVGTKLEPVKQYEIVCG